MTSRRHLKSVCAGCRLSPWTAARSWPRLSICSRGGARQVLAVAEGEQRVERMVIYVEPSSCGRDAALAAAASLARHLTIDVAMLVRDEERSITGSGFYRDLLDLRNASLRLHGLDIRTETFRGAVHEVIRERLTSSDEPTLLVIGLTSPER